MLASELVDRIMEVGGGYYSRTKALARLDQAQNLILSPGCEFTKRIVELPTTAGTLSYALPAVGTQCIRHVGAVYTALPISGYSAGVPASRSPIKGSDGTYYRYPLNGSTFVPANPVSGGGTLTLPCDPLGRTLFLVAYLWPVPLLTEATAITIPDDHADLLETEVLRLLYKRGYGNADNLAVEEKRLRRKWSVFLAGLPTAETDSRSSWGFN